MAACDLTVIIDEPQKARAGGETVTGTVVVKSEKDINCKALEVSCYWATHGRGNVARGDADSTTVFQGLWQAGQEYRYSFKLNSATWPPTYYGTYLNVSHFIGARAKVAWATDPKTDAEFIIASAVTPPDLSPTTIQKKSFNPIGWIVGGVIVAILLVFLAMVAFFLVPIALIAGALFWFFKVFLPKQLTGPIDLIVEPKSLKPGQALKGTCQFTPKRNLRINGITWTVKAIEKCVSGSGSNRTTHNHELLTKKFLLAEQGTLPSGQPQKYDLSFVFPSSVPPSLKFTDNELTWSSELRIDIPKWPDWTKSIPIVVEAKPNPSLLSVAQPDSPALTSEADDDPWLTEVLTQIVQSEDDPDRLETVLGAIKSHVFTVNLDIQGEFEEPDGFELDDEDSESEESDFWTAAIDPRRNAKLALLWPSDPANWHWTDDWRGSTSIIGWDYETQRVIMRVVEPKL